MGEGKGVAGGSHSNGLGKQEDKKKMGANNGTANG